ncbi:hypothetical protein FACS189459_2210 [Bacilli bacterium]|nr:hypothetical protein FACS189459_2210 [Bacilli bacterium]
MSPSLTSSVATDTFKSANFSKLTDLSIGKIQSGINYADNKINTLFGGITKNVQ